MDLGDNSDNTTTLLPLIQLNNETFLRIHETVVFIKDKKLVLIRMKFI